MRRWEDNETGRRLTDLEWDLTGVPFMDIVGLHLLFGPTMSGLGTQPLWLLLTAAAAEPSVFALSRLLPDIAPPGFRPPER